MAGKHLLVLAVAVLAGVAVVATGASECTLTSSAFYGAPWQAAFALYNTEAAWKKHGAITRIDMYYDGEAGCLMGMKATYGPQAEVSRLMGADKRADGPLSSSQLLLGAGEFINQAKVQYDSCIKYVSLTTNSGQVLAVGDGTSTGTVTTSAPESADGFLAYIKAYTDELSAGTLQRLQLVWASGNCPAQPADAINPAQMRMSVTADSPAVEASVTVTSEASAPETVVEAVVSADVGASAANATCKGGPACSDGQCATSSCALNGLGKDVLTMFCFGTNILPNTVLELTTGNPCTNLACKLDKTNCTSVGLLGVGGFCTGKVVAMGATAKLHPSGKAFVGYPCIEHKGPILDIMPVGDYTAKGVYASKAWKVCDCINGPGLHEDSLAFMTRDGGSIRVTAGDFPTLPHFPFFKKALVNMSLPDVLAQWVAANQAEASLPEIQLAPKQVLELQFILPNFTLPSLVVPRISAPLMKLPANVALPVFTIPGNETLAKVATVLPDITSLPTLMVNAALNVKVPEIRLPEVTIPNLGDLAATLGVPALPKLPPIFSMNFQDVVTQWNAANEFSMPVPRLHISDETAQGLKQVIAGFTVPSLIVTNISAPLLKLPSPFPVPVITITTEGDTLRKVSELIPKLTSLPSFVIPPAVSASAIKLPQLSLPNVTIPNFGEVAASLGASMPKWSSKLPQLLSSLNISMPDISIPAIKLPDFSIQQPQANLQLDLAGLTDMITVLTEHLDLPAVSPESSLDQAGWQDGFKAILGSIMSAATNNGSATNGSATVAVPTVPLTTDKGADEAVFSVASADPTTDGDAAAAAAAAEPAVPVATPEPAAEEPVAEPAAEVTTEPAEESGPAEIPVSSWVGEAEAMAVEPEQQAEEGSVVDVAVKTVDAPASGIMESGDVDLIPTPAVITAAQS